MKWRRRPKRSAGCTRISTPLGTAACTSLSILLPHISIGAPNARACRDAIPARAAYAPSAVIRLTLFVSAERSLCGADGYQRSPLHPFGERNADQPFGRKPQLGD